MFYLYVFLFHSLTPMYFEPAELAPEHNHVNK